MTKDNTKKHKKCQETQTKKTNILSVLFDGGVINCKTIHYKKHYLAICSNNSANPCSVSTHDFIN
jgi:hypothetical protein